MHGGFKVVYNMETKIKVLKNEGASYANIVIPFISRANKALMKESITGLDASAYNLEDGKVVRTQMTRDDVYEEQLNKSHKLLKFSIPNVREGTVFEYKLQLNSDFYSVLEDWVAQRDIPVVSAEMQILIPEYFKFNVDMRGSAKLEYKEKSQNITYNPFVTGMDDKIICSGRYLEFSGSNIPALRGDEYLWCVNDYLTSVRFELRGVDFPGANYRSFTTTWEKVDEELLDEEGFGGMLKMRNPYKKEMRALGISEIEKRQEKITAIYAFLKTKIAWNENYRLYGGDIKKVIQNGAGTNADINFILMSMLRDEKIPCFPVILSRKPMGILPYTHPSIQKLNTFVVAIADTDSTFAVLDGSVITGSPNVIPPQLMTNRARLVDKGRDLEKWLDLSQLGVNQTRMMTQATVDTAGLITGSRQAGRFGQHASEFRQSFKQANDSLEFIGKLESEDLMQVKSLKIEGLDDYSLQTSETLTFEKQAAVQGDFIYIYPLMFLHLSKNRFTDATRIMPLEIPYVERVSLVTFLTIPDGYKVDEMPEPINLSLPDKGATCLYTINQNGNTLQVRYGFSLNKLLFLDSEYPEFKQFWELVVEKNNQLLVLKKVSE